MKERKYILAYGDLRDGMPSAQFYKDVTDMQYVQTVDQIGYNMYTWNNKCVIRPGEDKIVCDIMECDQSTFEEIYKDAIKADFFVKQFMQLSTVKQGLLPCYLFVYKNHMPENLRVKEGDWIKYCLSKKINKDVIKKKESFEQFIKSCN